MISLDRYIVTKNGEIFDKENDNKPIKIFKSNKYLQCCIFDKNGKHTIGVHNVVAQALCADWFDGCVVHHEDNNPHNNHVDNLQCMELIAHVKGHVMHKYFDKAMKCPVCGKDFVWKAKQQSNFYRAKHSIINSPSCSRSCARKLINTN